MGMPEPKIPQNQICGRRRFGRILKSDHSGRIFELRSIGGHPRGVRQVSMLSELTVGESGVLVTLDLPESVQNHLMHMGFVPDALVTVLRRAPAGDPTVYGVDGMEIALRHETAAAIRVRRPEAEEPTAESPSRTTRLVEARDECLLRDAWPLSRPRLRRPRDSADRGADRAAQLRQIHSLQPADRISPESGQLPRRDGGAAHGIDGRGGPRRPDADRSAGNLLAHPSEDARVSINVLRGRCRARPSRTRCCW